MYGGLHSPRSLPREDALLLLARDFTPRVEAHGPTPVLLDLHGVGRVWPTPQELGRSLLDAAAARELETQVALAFTRTVVLVLAQARPGLTVVPAGGEADALAPLPLALLGLGGSALNSATNVLVADLYPEANAKAAALNRLGVFYGFGALLLPFLIGMLLDRVGLSPLLLAAAGLCVLTGALSAIPSYPGPKRSPGLTVGEALALLRHPLVAVFGALLFFEAGTEMLLGGYLTTFLTRETGASVREASWVLAGFWVALMTSRMQERKYPTVIVPFDEPHILHRRDQVSNLVG